MNMEIERSCGDDMHAPFVRLYTPNCVPDATFLMGLSMVAFFQDTYTTRTRYRREKPFADPSTSSTHHPTLT